MSGYLKIKAVAVRMAQRIIEETANFVAIDAAIETVRKQLGGFDEIHTSSITIRSDVEKIDNRVHIVCDAVTKNLMLLEEQSRSVKKALDSL